MVKSIPEEASDTKMPTAKISMEDRLVRRFLQVVEHRNLRMAAMTSLQLHDNEKYDALVRQHFRPLSGRIEAATKNRQTDKAIDNLWDNFFDGCYIYCTGGPKEKFFRVETRIQHKVEELMLIEKALIKYRARYLKLFPPSSDERGYNSSYEYFRWAERAVAEILIRHAPLQNPGFVQALNHFTNDTLRTWMFLVGPKEAKDLDQVLDFIREPVIENIYKMQGISNKLLLTIRQEIIEVVIPTEIHRDQLVDAFNSLRSPDQSLLDDMSNASRLEWDNLLFEVRRGINKVTKYRVSTKKVRPTTSKEGFNLIKSSVDYFFQDRKLVGGDDGGDMEMRRETAQRFAIETTKLLGWTYSKNTEHSVKHRKKNRLVKKKS